MKRWIVAVSLWVLSLAAAGANGAWPQKPVHIVVPGGTGGVTDVRARWLGAKLQEEIGQPVVIENRAGASGNIGMEVGARSAPDGYTLVIIHQGTMAVNPHLYPNLPYDPLRDFTPLTRLGHGPLMLVVNPALPVHSVQELVKLARTRHLNYGSPGVGTPPHLAVEIFKRESGIEATHIPYRGGGQSASDLIAGNVDFEIEGLTVVMPHVKAGRLRAIAITGTSRNAACPDVPTMREQGLADYEYSGWVGIAVPAATPAPIVQKVHDAIAKVLESPAARDWFGAAAADPTPDTPQAFAAVIRSEYDRFGRVIRDAGIKAE
ncbi:MAG TPA: tripartite tricarboxylate transporter substrate binding protein [Usitatibacter sp.]|nr:tripartite tricarboxylate transporter substrate binding protein [Usitatibacter sp.]